MLVEIFIGFLFVAVIVAFAIPNYRKIRMKLNMDLVEQNLRVIGEQMTELMRRDRKYPEDIAHLDHSKPEDIITSSLETIQKQKGYQMEGFQTSGAQTSYLVRVCPQKGKWGSAGDQCFILDTAGVRGLNPWDGTGLSMNLFAGNATEETKVNSNFSGVLTSFLEDKILNDEEKINLLTNLFEKTAYRLDFKRQEIPMDTCVSPEIESCAEINAPTATLFYFPKHLNAQYQRFISETYRKLRAKSIYLYQQEISSDQILQNNKNTQWGFGEESPASYLASRSDMKAVEVGFSLKNPVETEEELRQRTRNVGRTVEDWFFA